MDTTTIIKQTAMQTGDPASAFLSFLWVNYVTNPLFLSMVLVVLVLLWISRMFVFDNKNIKLNDKGWFYPAVLLFIIAFVVWLKGGLVFNDVKQYLADFVTQLSATLIVYTIVGHRLVKAGGMAGAIYFGLNEKKAIEEGKDKPVGL